MGLSLLAFSTSLITSSLYSTTVSNQRKYISPSLRGKKALVFGGTSGIGLAAAIQLREAGAHVIAVSRNPSKIQLQERDTDGIQLASCDVQDHTALSSLFTAEAPFDILVSTATGGPRARGAFFSLPPDAYQASFSKLWGYANVVRLGAEHMAHGGNIVLVSGCPARRAAPGQIVLASVGAAVEQFSRTVAPELACMGLRINVVSPGLIDTPMSGPKSPEKEKKLARITHNNLIPRAGEPDEVAHAIMFAVQNQFVTGTTIDVDGGWLTRP